MQRRSLLRHGAAAGALASGGAFAQSTPPAVPGDERAAPLLALWLHFLVPLAAASEVQLLQASQRLLAQGEKNPVLHDHLVSLVARLGEAAGNGASAAELRPALQALLATPHGRYLANPALGLMNHAPLWPRLGYEGSSFDKGGYLHRGFDDIDWLPPRQPVPSGKQRG
jgi:hypothetical protein